MRDGQVLYCGSPPPSVSCSSRTSPSRQDTSSSTSGTFSHSRCKRGLPRRIDYEHSGTRCARWWHVAARRSLGLLRALVRILCM